MVLCIILINFPVGLIIPPSNKHFLKEPWGQVLQ